jgi:hypothetical protein
LESKAAGRKANLKQYRAVNGKWQFVPVVRANRGPRPELALSTASRSAQRAGPFTSSGGKTAGEKPCRPVGTASHEALYAWQLQTGILSGAVEPKEQSLDDRAGKTVVTIDNAIERYLRE